MLGFSPTPLNLACIVLPEFRCGAGTETVVADSEVSACVALDIPARGEVERTVIDEEGSEVCIDPTTNKEESPVVLVPSAVAEVSNVVSVGVFDSPAQEGNPVAGPSEQF
jgi:hypothetical protein